MSKDVPLRTAIRHSDALLVPIRIPILPVQICKPSGSLDGVGDIVEVKGDITVGYVPTASTPGNCHSTKRRDLLHEVSQASLHVLARHCSQSVTAHVPRVEIIVAVLGLIQFPRGDVR